MSSAVVWEQLSRISTRDARKWFRKSIQVTGWLQLQGLPWYRSWGRSGLSLAGREANNKVPGYDAAPRPQRIRWVLRLPKYLDL